MSQNRLTVLIFILVLTLISLVSIECNRRPAPTNLLTRNFPRKYRSNSYDSFLELLNPILIERVSGTPGNTQVKNYLESKMKEYGCIVDLHDFTDNTPFGVRNFSNIVATYPVGPQFNENAKYTANRMVFACHYDSKYFDSIKFVGATDSAVPCAILLDMAKFFHENVDRSQLDRVSRHVQFIFFDGEEAFKEWTSTDSLYGSRRLAYDLKQQYGQRAFSSIDLFILLDLIGGDNTEMLNYFPQNSFSNLAFHVLSMIEKKLIGHKMLSSNKPRYFRDLDGVGKYYPMQDDHIPFLQENVPILHLIPFQFPTTWHTANDNLDNIIPANVQDLRLIMKWFLIEMIHKSNSDEEKVQGQVNDKYKDEF